MQRKALTANLAVILVAMVAALLVFLGVNRVLTGQMNSGVDGAISGVQDLFSMCDKDVTLNFNDFLKEMDTVYRDCKDNNKCGKNTCVTVDLSTSGVGCYRVNREAIWKYTSDFATIPLCTFAANTYNLYCNDKSQPTAVYTDPYGDFYDGIAYYGPSDDKYCKLDDSWVGCMASYFSVGNGAKVKLTAKKGGLLLKNTDLKVRVKGGSGYDACTPYVNTAPPECTVANEATTCTKTTWGWCDGSGKCRYDHYCRERDNPLKCQKLDPFECKFSTGCPPPPKSLTCPALPATITAQKLMWPGTPAIEYWSSESGLPIRMGEDQETCYAYNNVFNLYNRVVSCSDPQAKISLNNDAFKKVDDDTYTTIMRVGCY